jgi:fibronectin type 3 domain-containing protein
LVVVTKATDKINLTWKDNAKNETGFRIKRKDGVRGTYAKIASVGVNVNGYVDASVVENTLYFYTVCAFNAKGVSACSKEEASYTVKMNLLAPTGGEVIFSGSTYLIQWETVGTVILPPVYKLEYSLDGGITWRPIAQGVTETTYSWTVPTLAQNQRDCLLRVQAFDSEGVKRGGARSDFTIEVVKLTAPNGGEILSPGTNFDITWETRQTVRPVSKVKLLSTRDGGVTWTPIITLDGNPGSHPWPVPTVLKAKKQCRVRVQLLDEKGVQIGSDASDLYFTLKP